MAKKAKTHHTVPNPMGEKMGITSNVIYRTFLITRSDLFGTAFTIDFDGKQYLVTARHVVEGIKSVDEIGILRDESIKRMKVRVVGIGAGEIDIAVLACPMELSPPFPMEASPLDFTYGQSVYFLGFPLGWNCGGLDCINRGYPLPLVKSGIISLFDTDVSRIWIDGHGNKGFSGGPVIFQPNSQKNAEYKVAGVVSRHPLLQGKPVVDKRSRPMEVYFYENPGIVVAYNIRHAIDLICANPIGFDLPRYTGPLPMVNTVLSQDGDDWCRDDWCR